jgi:predicted RNase H-like nuclease (RuvC/YqgF family)
MAAGDWEHEETVAHLQAELAHAVAAQKRLQALLGRAEAEQQRLDAEHATDRAESERARHELSVLKNQLLKSANQRIELEQWQETASTLERLADMGRLAMQFSCELHGAIATLDERSRLLLNLSRGEVSHHPITAAVHDAVRATSLAQQLPDTNVEPPLDPETP